MLVANELALTKKELKDLATATGYKHPSVSSGGAQVITCHSPGTTSTNTGTTATATSGTPIVRPRFLPATTLGGTPARPRPLPSNTTYGGKDEEDWVTFRDNFYNIVLFYEYNDQQGKRALRACMKGAAALSVAQIDHENPAQSLNDLLDV